MYSIALSDKWEKEIAKRIKLEQYIKSDQKLLNYLIMDNNCLIALAKIKEYYTTNLLLFNF